MSRFENEKGKRLFQLPASFMLAVASPEQCPTTNLPEVAFSGRSNVGKSSLVNALTGRKGLARASNTPGRTQQIIFFDLGQRMNLVDLPGYGFAEAPPLERVKWNELVNHYLRTRASLCVVCLLVDGRHGTLAADLEMMKILDRAAVSYRVVLTKADKVSDTELNNRIQQIEESLKGHPAAVPKVMATSADKGRGLDELRETLAAFVKD